MIHVTTKTKTKTKTEKISNTIKTKRAIRTALLELEPAISIPKNTINKNLHYDVAHI